MPILSDRKNFAKKKSILILITNETLSQNFMKNFAKNVDKLHYWTLEAPMPCITACKYLRLVCAKN